MGKWPPWPCSEQCAAGFEIKHGEVRTRAVLAHAAFSKLLVLPGRLLSPSAWVMGSGYTSSHLGGYETMGWRSPLLWPGWWPPPRSPSVCSMRGTLSARVCAVGLLGCVGRVKVFRFVKWLWMSLGIHYSREISWNLPARAMGLHTAPAGPCLDTTLQPVSFA